MRIKYLIILLIISPFILIFTKCNLKKSEIQLDSNVLVSYVEKDGGIKFKKRGEDYICLKSPPSEMQELGINKTYTLSFSLKKSNTDTVFTLKAECFNINKPLGLNWLYLSFNINHFKGAKTYLLSDYSFLYCNFIKDKDGPSGKWIITDGYLKIEDFNWQTNRVKGSFYFQFFNFETNEYLIITDGFINL
jgi:hypothetical protein